MSDSSGAGLSVQEVPALNEIWVLTNKTGIGRDVGMLLPGLNVTIAEIVDCGTQGVGNHGEGEKVVVVRFSEKGLTHDNQGNVIIGDIPRAISVGYTDFIKNFSPQEV